MCTTNKCVQQISVYVLRQVVNRPLIYSNIPPPSKSIDVNPRIGSLPPKLNIGLKAILQPKCHSWNNEWSFLSVNFFAKAFCVIVISSYL